MMPSELTPSQLKHEIMCADFSDPAEVVDLLLSAVKLIDSLIDSLDDRIEAIEKRLSERGAGE